MINLIVFLITTALYFLTIKPQVTMETLAAPDYLKSIYMSNGIYVACVLISQFFVNVATISTMCSGNIRDNIGSAFVSTFVPWTLLFVPLLLVLFMYPGLKSLFSDVIGYYWVANSANELLNELLIDPQLKDDASMQVVTNLVLKIYGNNSLMINQMTPSSFSDYWNRLQPLIKPQYRDGTNGDIKKKLFELVVTRDNVGEAMWLIYTGILVVSLVQLKISSRGCVQSQRTMEANYKKYLEQEEKAAKEKETIASTTYTM